MSDNVLLFRYYEYAGEVRQALSVFKRRGRAARAHHPAAGSQHASTGIDIGEPLREFHGVLTGIPTYERLRAVRLKVTRRDPSTRTER